VAGSGEPKSTIAAQSVIDFGHVSLFIPFSFIAFSPSKGDFDYTLLPVKVKEKSGQNPCRSA
jgi:hypothetical protein